MLKIRKALAEEKSLVRGFLVDYLRELKVSEDLLENYPFFDSYWNDADKYPYLIDTGGEQPVGFAFIERKSYLGMAVDFSIAEFYILPVYRRHGFASKALQEIFKLHPGQWELSVLNHNTSALSFWPGALKKCAAKDVEVIDRELTRVLRFSAG